MFHMTLCLANMYVTMQLTQWFQPQEATIISFNKSWSTVILKEIYLRIDLTHGLKSNQPTILQPT